LKITLEQEIVEILPVAQYGIHAESLANQHIYTQADVMPFCFRQAHHCLHRSREGFSVSRRSEKIVVQIRKNFAHTGDVSDNGGQPTSSGFKQCNRKPLPSGAENEAIRSTHPGQDFGLKARKIHTVSESEILDKCVQLVFELTIAENHQSGI
jgi:hypothetical protein